MNDVSSARVVAIANAMYNPCRPANLAKSGNAASPQDAWRIILERRDLPFVKADTKWERLVAALGHVPAWAADRIQNMDIQRLGVLSAALINGPYKRM